MQNQKLEDVLNLSLEATGKEREKSRQLDVGYLEEEKRWELIVKYNGSLQPLSGDLIQVSGCIFRCWPGSRPPVSRRLR